ncbi:MAG: nitroreductase family protein [Bacteroidales bacterium]|nr:nitroreductase family protein [Bacteroidales bacterium]
MNNAFLDLIRTRRSIRFYQPEQIGDDELATVLDAGTYAPTGHGLQDPWIVAVQNPDLRRRLSQLNASFIEPRPDYDPYYGAPTVVLVFCSSPEKCKTGQADGALVLGTMMLAAHAIGLGTCWINREREMFDTDEGRALMAEMGLPEGLVGVGALSLGHIAKGPKPNKPRKENYYRVVK